MIRRGWNGNFVICSSNHFLPVSLPMSICCVQSSLCPFVSPIYKRRRKYPGLSSSYRWTIKMVYPWFNLQFHQVMKNSELPAPVHQSNSLKVSNGTFITITDLVSKDGGVAKQLQSFKTHETPGVTRPRFPQPPPRGMFALNDVHHQVYGQGAHLCAYWPPNVLPWLPNYQSDLELIVNEGDTSHCRKWRSSQALPGSSKIFP